MPKLEEFIFQNPTELTKYRRNDYDYQKETLSNHMAKQNYPTKQAGNKSLPL